MIVRDEFLRLDVSVLDSDHLAVLDLGLPGGDLAEEHALHILESLARRFTTRRLISDVDLTMEGGEILTGT